MSTKIDINDIIDANSHNSAMALTAAWATCFKKYAMEDYEDLSDSPASSFNIFTHLTAQGAAKMMYEQAARISETNISTAILPKSLINQLSVDEMNGIFGTPASTTIAFCIAKDDIIQNAIMDDDDKVYRLVINKELVTTFESHPSFTLPYDVIINYKPVQIREIDEKTGDIISGDITGKFEDISSTEGCGPSTSGGMICLIYLMTVCVMYMELITNIFHHVK